MPYILAFTLETDGKLPNKESLEKTIDQCDEYLTKNKLTPPVYYGINCCHPLHCKDAFSKKVVSKVFYMRANPSKMSHEELDNATELDEGVPEEFAKYMVEM